MMQQGQSFGHYSTSTAAPNSLDLDQSVQQLSLPVQQYQHVVVEARGHGPILRFPWLVGGSFAFLGRYATTLQCTWQQARHTGISISFIQPMFEKMTNGDGASSVITVCK
jgi:hypothetical protein